MLLLLLNSVLIAGVAPFSNGAAGEGLASEGVSLSLAIEDLIETYGEAYPRGVQYRNRLQSITEVAAYRRLKKEALLSHPLLDFERMIVLKRSRGQLGLPTNHQCNTTLSRKGYDNEIAILSPMRPAGELSTLFRPTDGAFVGEIDLHFDAERLLFTMTDDAQWNIFEIGIDGTGMKQISQDAHADVDSFDGCYLPDGRIVFASTASYTAVPCWHGQERACSLYVMDGDGANMRQLCFDQDLDLHPAVLSDGRVIYSKWDYTGIMHMYMRPLMTMNPDGTAQRAVYGSNSYWPNALFFPREIPGHPGKLICIMAGYHNDPRMGQLVLIDLAQGWADAQGVKQLIPGRGKKIEPIIRDRLTEKTWPKFLHPYPLSVTTFLVSMQPSKGASWGIYLVDVFDNIQPILVDPAYDFFEPTPIVPRERPRVIPDQVDLARDDAVIYMHDVYAGPGLAGVPRGTIKALRVAAYHYGLPNMAGPDKCGSGGPWEVMRILGTVPINEDGSAVFRVPACTPLTLQPLDHEGKAVQLMRSWYTAMPGETISCVGCHEAPNQSPLPHLQAAALQTPRAIEPWYGPARGFDFAREVQPVLDAYCVTCHNEKGEAKPDLRAASHFPYYPGRQLSRLGRERLHVQVKTHLGGTRVRYTPSYEALLPYIRRVNVEDDVRMLVPGEYHADTSELIQMLQIGHHGIRLDAESWDRLITWIDLNGPCHGTWNDVAPVPFAAGKRRWQLAQMYGGPKENPEVMPALAKVTINTAPRESPTVTRPQPSEMPVRRLYEASGQQVRKRLTQRSLLLEPGIEVTFNRIPPGRFTMGDALGETNERPAVEATINSPFWMSVCEITNEQYHCFDPNHRSGVYTKRFLSRDGPGISLENAGQPVVRVSWERARAFCEWLSRRTGARFDLPSEDQWEYACRAGTHQALNYGSVDDDFSRHANMADASLRVAPVATGGLDSNINLHRGNGVFESALYGSIVPCAAQFDDAAIVTAEVGSYTPNAWGLFDMHGNVGEWTRSTYRAYPFEPEDGRNEPDAVGEKVVRGGSWVDRPKRCRSAARLSYPAWQRVFNVGFRVVCVAEDLPASGD